jgi:CheY-like chemotaxis protein
MPNLLQSPWDHPSQPLILIVEDSDEDFYTLLRAVDQIKIEASSSYSFLRLEDGDEAIDYLLRQGDYAGLETPLPIAMLLDLNLPGTDGREVIQEVRQHDGLRVLPIIVLTTSRNAVDIECCYRYGANSYLLKPMGSEKIQTTVKILFQYWFNLAILPSHG